MGRWGCRDRAARVAVDQATHRLVRAIESVELRLSACERLQAESGDASDMTGDDRATVSIGRYRDPAVRYDVRDSCPVLVGTNDQFEETFGSFPTGTPLSTVFEEPTVTVPDPEQSFPDCLVDDPVPVCIDVHDGTWPPDRYVGRGVAPTDDSPGSLLFVETTSFERATGQAVRIDRVASVISHDLRNPLDVAKARLRAGRETGADEHFDHVVRAHDRMERIIEDVLTLAGTETVVDPSGTVELETAARTAWGTVETASARLQIDGPLPTVVADDDRIGRLFENLFRNAVEHGSTSPGSHARQDAIEHAGTGDGSDPDPRVTVGTITARGFYVADDGPGIPPAYQERIFEPGVTETGSGTGLGLAIVERIVEAHGWSISVTTGKDGGARFEITGIDT